MSHNSALPGSPEEAKEILFHLKDHFVHHNITRLRELIRYLPEKKLTLFHLIPFLLHVNRPDLPGYINHPVATFGVYNLMDTGIWNVAIDHFSTSDTAIAPYLSSRNHILAMYLMGSTGTLAQGDQSDFDYWVIIDENKTPPMRQRVLSQKLNAIENWAAETFDQQLNFFLLGAEQVRANRYAELDAESSGSAQKTILKEEFYRTFIWVCGKIPFWAVLPTGLDNPLCDPLIV